MSERLPKVEAMWIGDKMPVVVDNNIGHVYIPVVTIEELMADTLNWFDEDGMLCVGSKSNSEHVAAWQRWNEVLKG